MRDWPVTIVSAFGRGETLGLALHENGFQVTVLDFTGAFPPETHRGMGPFPIVNKTYLPAQRDLLRNLKALPHGVNIWLKDGPMDLSGALSEVHAESHPELRAWKAGSGDSGPFESTWLTRWLKQWAAPFYSESWADDSSAPFPATSPLGLIPAELEERAASFMHLNAKGLNVRACSGIHEVRTKTSRLEELEVNCGSRVAVQSPQWVWCLSSHETQMISAEAARILFWRGALKPSWAWLSFEGTMQSGPWAAGLPELSVVIGDVFLPWAHANTFILRRLEGGRLRVWLKVPRVRTDNIDARRGWALGAENILRARLPLADWRIDSGAWSIGPQSEVFGPESRGEVAGHWKNWDWIAGEVLPRLDVSARLEREAAAFTRLMGWRNQQLKKQGVPRDHALHAP